MVGQAALETGIGMAVGAINDKRQLRQQGKLLEQQAGIDRKQAAFNQALGMQTWRETGPVALTEELKKAGLSPALQYGGGAAGGGTTNFGGSGVSSHGSPTGGGEILGLQMMNAQRQLIEAQTRNTEADTANKEGVDRELKGADITKRGAETKLIGVQSELAEIEKSMKTATYEDTKAMIQAAAQKAQSETAIAANDKTISDKTKNNRIDLVEGELIGLTLANELKRAQTGLAEEQIKKVIADVKQGWMDLDIKDKNAMTNLMNSQTARINAQTSIREFLEHVRKTDYDYEIRRGTLELQRWLHDVPESGKLTVGALQDVLGTVQRKGTKQEK